MVSLDSTSSENLSENFDPTMSTPKHAAADVVAQPEPRQRRIFYGWYLVAASFLSNTVTAGIYWQGFQVFFLPLIREYGWSRAALSGAFAMRQMETGIAAPLVGLAVDRLGPRKVIMLSAVMLSLGMALVGFTSNLLTFYLFFFIASLGASGTSHSISWAVAISRWFNRLRGTAIGIGTSGPTLAGGVLLVLGWAVESFGWRAAVWAGAAVLFLVLVPLSLLVRDRPEDMGLRPDGATLEEASTLPGKARAAAALEGTTVRQAIRERAFWAMTLLFSCLFLGQSGMQVHQVPFFQSDMSLSATEAAITVAVVLLLSGVGRVGGGVIADLVDVRLVLAGTVGLNVLSWVYLLLVPITSLALAIPYAVLFGIPFGAMVSVRPLLMVKLFGNRSLGLLMGLFQAGTLASGIFGPLIMGWLFDVQGTYRMSLFLFMAVSAAALPLVALIKPRVNGRINGPTLN